MYKNEMRKWTDLLFSFGMVFIMLCTTACSPNIKQENFNAQIARQKLDEALVNSVTDANGQIQRNAVIRVDIPEYNFTYAGAAGIARQDSGESMTVDHQFTVASIGKTMTAVVILQLWEEGYFGEKGLDATLADLEAFPPDVLDNLHKINGVSYGRQITVRQLLNQTSGLKDVLMDDENGLGEDYPAEYRGYAPGSLNGLVVFDPEKGFTAMMDCIQQGIPAGCSRDDYYLSYTWPHWDYQAWLNNPHDKMAGLLNFYLGGMNETALWQPGTAFHYADTNYIILGLLAEKLTGHSLHQELRTRIFDPLGMDHTYLAYATQPPTAPWEQRLSDHWGSDTPLISMGVNLSTDWGAGGEVSTVRDLTLFIRALAENKLFSKAGTLQEMLALPDGIEQPFYAAGIIVWDTGDGLILHHNGAPGSWIEYHSADGISITGTVNDLDRPDRFLNLRGEIYNALSAAGLHSYNLKTGQAGMGLLNLMNGAQPAYIPIGLLGCVLLFLSALIIWGIGFLRKRNRQSKPAALARWLAAIAMAINLVFLAVLVISVMQNPVQLLFGLNQSLMPVFLLPILSAILSLAVLLFAIFAWKENYWNMAGRIHFSILTLALLGFFWLLNTLHLIIL